MMGILSRVIAQKHCSGNVKRCFTTEPVLSFDVSGPRNVEKTSSLHCKEQTHHDKKQIKEAQIIRCLCRIMESHVWGPNTEPLLQPYTPHLSNTVISQVILKQKSLDMAKKFFQWSRRCRPLTHNANVNDDNGDAGVDDIDVDGRGYDADVVVDNDAHAYHALLIKLGVANEFDEMWKLIHEMKDNGCGVCSTTFSILLKAYSTAGLPHHAINAMKKVHEFGVGVDVPLYTTLLGVLFKAKIVGHAKSVYKTMLKENYDLDGSAWSTLIRGFGKCGCIEESEMCWQLMVNRGFEPQIGQYNAFIEGLCECRNLNKALDTLGLIKEKGLEANAYSFNPILGGLCKVGRYAEALNMFSEMEDVCSPNQATCNTLLEGLFLSSDVSSALAFYESLEKKGLTDSRSYCILATGLKKARQMDKLILLSQELHSKNGSVNVWLCNAILYFHSHDQSNVEKAISYFEQMLNGLTHPDVASFATMINGYCKIGKLEEAMKLLSGMEGRGCKPNAFCYSPLIAALLKAPHNRVSDGLRLFREMLQRGLETNAVTSDFLLRKLSEAGFVDESLWLCDFVMGKKYCIHRVTSLALMDCLKRAGRMDKAKALWPELEQKGCLVDGTIVDKALQVLRGTV